MVYRLLFASVALFGFSLSSLMAEEPLNRTYAWKELEQSLDIQRQFKELGQKVCPEKDQGAPSASLSDMSQRSRQIIYALCRRMPSREPMISQMIVAACAYSGQPSAMDVMEQVLELRNGYPISSWLCAMQYLATQPDPRACDLLIRCLGIPYGQINLVGAYFLSQNSYANSNPEMVERLLAVQRRFGSRSSSWMVELLSHFDQPAAAQAIRKMFQEAPPETQAEILQILAESPFPFDDLVTRAFASSSPVLLEGALYYSLLHASSGTPWLAHAQRLCASPYPRVATLAQIACLKSSNDEQALSALIASIKSGDLHAITGCGLLARLSNSGLDEAIKKALQKQLTARDWRVSLASAMSLLEALDPSGLRVLAQIVADPQVMITSSMVGSYSWPIYQVQWLPSMKDPLFQMSMAQQLQSRRWIFDKVNRLPMNVLSPWYDELVQSEEGSCHFLISSTLGSLATPAMVELLKSWSEMPGKPWLRLGSHLSLWRLNRERESLEQLQAWMNRNSEAMACFLTSVSSSNPMMKGESWVGNFETQVLLQVAQALCENGDPKSLQSLCNKISNHEHPLEMLPLIAQISRYL